MCNTTHWAEGRVTLPYMYSRRYQLSTNLWICLAQKSRAWFTMRSCRNISTNTLWSHSNRKSSRSGKGDQNGIKQSMFLLGADQGIKNSEQLISTNQHILSDTKEAWKCFCPFNPWIKWSRALEGNVQAIKDNFHWLRFLIPVANASTGHIQVTTPCLA